MADPSRYRSREWFKQRIRVLNEKKCTTAAQINAVLSEMAELTESAVVSGIVEILIEEFSRLQAETPVDTGRAKAAWLITGNRGAIEFVPGENEATYTPQSPNPSDFLTANTIIVVNNVPYILVLNAGWSKQQPAGFIDGFLLRVKRRVDALATEISQVR